ncbi:FAD/FMN-containing dehydrogenase [Actinocorallia herbida]|uniref:FAD/FMN-containing dehydrogenase n=1 Tax=Actinocorallia herbida TaxID=58109 RepID=A0A3N1CVZ9_9ACTN|nr:FAD-binding oxidoreductase [Actinocorallia herbida]ROO85460.1 FAD/FMN-containing dehydrogenase [Actinocorallia herbida]
MHTFSGAAAPDLRALMAGAVLAPGEEGYAEAVAPFNLAVPRRPALVAVAQDAADVAAAVRFARRHRLPVAVQATGHGAVGPDEGALLVNTAALDHIAIDPVARTARIGAGVRFGALLEAAAPHGLAPLTGSAPAVGVVGYTLGGGLSPVGRALGYAADHVRALEVVTADGRIRQVDAAHEPDLFWALRGGKGGFGIVTSMTVGLFSVRSLFAGAVYYAGEDAPEVLRAWRNWSAELPERSTTSVALLRLPPLPELPEPLRGRFVVAVRYAHVGAPEEGAALLVRLHGALGEVRPVLDGTGEIPFAAIGSVHADPTDPMPVWERGLLFDDLPETALGALVKTAGADADEPPFMVEIRQLGGALSRQPEGGNAVGGRDAVYSLLVVGAPPPEELTSLVAPAGARVIDALRPCSRDAALPNFLGSAPSPADIAAAWPPAVRDRLRAVKAAYDPSGLFRFGCGH